MINPTPSISKTLSDLKPNPVSCRDIKEKTMTASQVKAMLRKHLVFHDPGEEDTDVLYVDDPYVGAHVNWGILDKLIDKEFTVE